MPTVSYEYIPNTIVDALNEVHQKLNDSEVKYATTVTDALNNISVDLGGARHLRAPEAIKDIGEHLSSGGSGDGNSYRTVNFSYTLRGESAGTDSVSIIFPQIGGDPNKYIGVYQYNFNAETGDVSSVLVPTDIESISAVASIYQGTWWTKINNGTWERFYSEPYWQFEPGDSELTIYFTNSDPTT